MGFHNSNGTENPDDAKKFCSNCGEQIDARAEICPHCGGRVAMPPSTKNPTIAVILSFFVIGLGQVYNGKYTKAIIMFVLAVVSVMLWVWGIGIGEIPLLIIWIWSMADAWKVAKGTGGSTSGSVNAVVMVARGFIPPTRTKIIMCALLIVAALMSGCLEDDPLTSTPEVEMPTPTPAPEAVSEPAPEATPVPTPKIDVKDDIIIVFDISDSMSSEIVINTQVTCLDYEKALVIDILDDKDFRDDCVGMVAFGGNAYEVAGLTYLGNDAARESLKETIMTIEPQGEITTTLDQGLAMAEEMLANSAGATDVIIISDGNIDAGIYESSLSVAARMNNADTRMHFIHVMRLPTKLVTKFEDLAHSVDGTYQQTTYPALVVILTSQATATHTLSPPSPDPIPVPTSTFIELEDEPEPKLEVSNHINEYPIYISVHDLIWNPPTDTSKVIIKDLHIRLFAPVFDPNVLWFVGVDGRPISYLDNIEIKIDDITVASFMPEMRNPKTDEQTCERDVSGIIYLPENIKNTGKISVIGSFMSYENRSRTNTITGITETYESGHIGNFKIMCQIDTPLIDDPANFWWRNDNPIIYS